MSKKTLLLMAAAMISVVIFGCGGGEKGKMNEQEKGSADFVVKVDGKAITEEEVAKETSNIERQMAGRVSPEQMGQMGQMLRQQAVQNLVNRALLTEAAKDNGVKVTDAEVDSRIEQIKGQFKSEEDFNGQLEKSGMTPDGFREEVRKSIRLENLMDMKTAHISSPTEAESREYYDSNAAQFSNPERIRASHILISVGENDTEEQKEQKRKKIEEIRSELLAGADFAELAAKYSDCPSKDRGGDLGFFARGQMVKPFEDAAFALDVGQISDVVTTRFGYHIIKVTEKEDAGKVSFDDARSNIEEFLLSRKKQAEINDYLDKLRDSAEIVYADSSLQAGAAQTP